MLSGKLHLVIHEVGQVKVAGVGRTRQLQDGTRTSAVGDYHILVLLGSKVCKTESCPGRKLNGNLVSIDFKSSTFEIPFEEPMAPILQLDVCDNSLSKDIIGRVSMRFDKMATENRFAKSWYGIRGPPKGETIGKIKCTMWFEHADGTVPTEVLKGTENLSATMNNFSPFGSEFDSLSPRSYSHKLCALDEDEEVPPEVLANLSDSSYNSGLVFVRSPRGDELTSASSSYKYHLRSPVTVTTLTPTSFQRRPLGSGVEATNPHGARLRITSSSRCSGSPSAWLRCFSCLAPCLRDPLPNEDP